MESAKERFVLFVLDKMAKLESALKERIRMLEEDLRRWKYEEARTHSDLAARIDRLEGNREEGERNPSS